MSNRRRREGRRINEVYGGASGSSQPGLHQNSLVRSAGDVSMHVLNQTRSSADCSSMIKGSSAGGRTKGRQYGGPSTKSGGIGGGGPGSTSSESMVSQGDYDRYEGFYEKRRSAIGVITGIFTCWSKTKDGQSGSLQDQQLAAPRLNSLTTAAILEQAKAQHEALLETQDTSDMWEWHMEQQQAIASQEHQMLERTSNATIGDQLATAPPALLTNSGSGGDNSRPLIRLKKPSEAPAGEVPNEDAEDDAAQEWGSPAWGWQRQDEVAAEKMSQMFEAALLRCHWEINTFCRIYMQQIVKAGYSLISTLMEMETNTVFLRRVHASYALEARINAALFRYFENDSFDDSGLTHIFDPSARAASRLQEFVRMKGLDPAEALRMHSPSYEPAFHNFAAAKSEEVLALLPAAALAFRSAEQRDRFMDAFLRAAKWAWLLHRLATSATHPATILRVARGHPVDPLYVEAVAVPPIGSCSYCPVTALPTVEFMIMPGFVAQSKVFRCRIYQHFMCKQQ